MGKIMSENSGLIVGIDIQENTTQLSVLDEKDNVPKQVNIFDGKPAVSNPIPLTHWRLSGDGGNEDSERLCEISSFISSAVDTVKKAAGRMNCEKICITVAGYEKEVLDFLSAVMDRLEFRRSQWCVISHEESFAYYAYNQKRELYHPAVLLLDYSGERIDAYLMASGSRKNLEIIMENRYFLENDNIKACAGKELALEDIEEDIIGWLNEIFSEHIVSAVYLTGNGFDVNKFPDRLTKFLCGKRKVFAGQNLYVKGAVFCAAEEVRAGRFANTVLACSNRITTGIEVDISERGKDRRLRVVKPGINWYGAARKMDFIIEDIRQINLYMKPCDDSGDYTEQIDISTIPYRKGKMTRIEFEVSFLSDAECIVTVRDKGFGDFVRSSGKVIEKTLTLR